MDLRDFGYLNITTVTCGEVGPKTSNRSVFSAVESIPRQMSPRRALLPMESLRKPTITVNTVTPKDCSFGITVYAHASRLLGVWKRDINNHKQLAEQGLALSIFNTCDVYL